LAMINSLNEIKQLKQLLSHVGFRSLLLLGNWISVYNFLLISFTTFE